MSPSWSQNPSLLPVMGREEDEVVVLEVVVAVVKEAEVEVFGLGAVVPVEESMTAVVEVVRA